MNSLKMRTINYNDIPSKDGHILSCSIRTG